MGVSQCPSRSASGTLLAGFSVGTSVTSMCLLGGGSSWRPQTIPSVGTPRDVTRTAVRPVAADRRDVTSDPPSQLVALASHNCRGTPAERVLYVIEQDVDQTVVAEVVLDFLGFDAERGLHRLGEPRRLCACKVALDVGPEIGHLDQVLFDALVLEPHGAKATAGFGPAARDAQQPASGTESATRASIPLP
jgi:hypothetical protein